MASLKLVLDILARDGASKVLDKIGVSAGGVGKVAAAGLAGAGAAVAGFAAVSVKAGADFDSTLRQMGAVAGVPAAELKGLSDLALKFGADTTFSAQQAADAMLELSKGGLSAADIKAGALKETLTLASAGGLDLADAAKAMSDTLNTFGLEAKDAGQISAALAGAANASSASVSDLQFGLAQAGASARNAGLSVQETTAVLASFANNGLAGSDAGTSLKTMLTRLVPSTASAARAMEQFGLFNFDAAKAMEFLRSNGVKPLGSDQAGLERQIRKVIAAQRGVKEESFAVTSAYEKLIYTNELGTSSFIKADGSFRDISEVAGQLQTKLAGLTQEEQSRALAAIFGSDATRAATILMREGTKGVEENIRATSDQAAANRVAASRTEGLKGAYEQLTGSVETLAIKTGLALAPAAEKAVKFATALVNNAEPAVRTLLSAVSPLGPVVSKAFDVVKGLVGFVADNKTVFGAIAVGAGAFAAVVSAGAIASGAASLALGAYISVMAFGIGVLGKIKSAVLLFNAALAANPIGVVIALVAGLTAGLVFAYKNSETFRRTVDGAFRKVAEAGRFMWERVLKPVFRFLVETWLAVAGSIVEGAADAFSWVPGLGPKLRVAADKFRDFREKTNAQLDKLRDQEVKVTAKGFSVSDVIASENRRDAARAANNVARRATGGAIFGPGTGTSDSIRALLSNGEHVWRAREVEAFGGHEAMERFRALVRAGQVPAFRDGGGVSVRASTPGPRVIVDPMERHVDRFANRLGKQLYKALGEIGGDGSGAGIGYKRQMGLLRRVFPGLPLISGFRPGAITATGNRSYHAQGRAVDLPPRTDVFNWIRSNYGRATRELIFSPQGRRQIHNGRPHFYSGVTRANHFDHVHWAMAKGGPVDLMAGRPKPRAHAGGTVTADLPRSPGLAADERELVTRVGEQISTPSEMGDVVALLGDLLSVVRRLPSDHQRLVRAGG